MALLLSELDWYSVFDGGDIVTSDHWLKCTPWGQQLQNPALYVKVNSKMYHIWEGTTKTYSTDEPLLLQVIVYELEKKYGPAKFTKEKGSE